MHAFASFLSLLFSLPQMDTLTLFNSRYDRITLAFNHVPQLQKTFMSKALYLANGTSDFETSIDVELGDIGFMDENEGLFHKLYNIAEPLGYTWLSSSSLPGDGSFMIPRLSVSELEDGDLPWRLSSIYSIGG